MKIRARQILNTLQVAIRVSLSDTTSYKRPAFYVLRCSTAGEGLGFCSAFSVPVYHCKPSDSGHANKEVLAHLIYLSINLIRASPVEHDNFSN